MATTLVLCALRAGAATPLPVVQVNLLSASQVAMAALAGVLFFGEALSIALVAGVLLTTLGLLMIKRGEKEPRRSVELITDLADHPDLTDPAGRVAWSTAGEE